MEIKKVKTNKSVSLNKSTINRINSFSLLNDLDFSGKLETMSLDYIAIIEHSMKEIKDTFTNDEIEILINACNMLILHTDKISPAFLIHNAIVMYSSHFECIVPEAMEFKILNLTTAQSYALLRALQSFWIDKDYSKLEIIIKKKE